MISFNPHRRRAVAYIVVLGTAAFVALIGLSGLATVRTQRRAATGSTDSIEAAAYAQSAVEMGLHWINAEPDWRTNRLNGYWKTDQPIGNGTYSLQVIDPGDANLANSTADPLILIGTGVKGQARRTLQVNLVSQGQPLTCLETSLHAGNDLTLDGVTVQCDQIISANNNSIATSANVNADVEAVNSISGQFYNQLFTSGVPVRTMPNSSTVFDEYVAAGATMDINLLSSSGAGRAIKDTLISPMNNPYGTTNADGIYVLDCKGEDLRIENCRIYGTLILLNFGANTEIRNSVNWQPALSNYPSLMAQGSIAINLTSTSLSEATIGLNLNPDGAPYQGNTNGDMLDTYPSMISGLVYVSNDLTTGQSSTFDGVVVVGAVLTATGTLNLTYRRTFHDNPPPGFGSAGTMALSPGSWMPVVN